MKNLPDRLTLLEEDRFRKSFGMTYSCAKTLMDCPVDVFFVQNSVGPGPRLRGTTLKALAVRGYLNAEYCNKKNVVEYYLNNNGHRVKAKLIAYWSANG